MNKDIQDLLESAEQGDEDAALRLELLVEREAVEKQNDDDIADILGPHLLALRLGPDVVDEIVQRVGRKLSTAADSSTSLAWIVIKSYNARALPFLGATLLRTMQNEEQDKLSLACLHGLEVIGGESSRSQIEAASANGTAAVRTQAVKWLARRAAD